MNVADVLAELVGREALTRPGAASPKSETMLTGVDLQRWATLTGLGTPGLLDALAEGIARDYDEGLLSFGQCDGIVQDLYTCTLFSEIERPELFLAVFYAFDAGEFYLDHDRTKDPEQLYTRPMISEVLRQAEP